MASDCMLDHLIDDPRPDWSALAGFLNNVASFYSMTDHIETSAFQDVFLKGGSSLHENYLIRGLVWAQWYFARG